MMDRLFKGAVFSTFREFDMALKEYQHDNNVVFCSHNAALISKHNERVKSLDKKWPLEWKYKSATFQCKFAGEYQPKGPIRNTRSYKCGCLARVKISANKALNGLLITDVNLEHNNHKSVKFERVAKAIPECRRLTDAAMNDVQNLLALKERTVTIIDFISSKHGISVETQDIHNMKKTWRKIEAAARKKRAQAQGLDTSGWPYEGGAQHAMWQGLDARAIQHINGFECFSSNPGAMIKQEGEESLAEWSEASMDSLMAADRIKSEPGTGNLTSWEYYDPDQNKDNQDTMSTPQKVNVPPNGDKGSLCPSEVCAQEKTRLGQALLMLTRLKDKIRELQKLAGSAHLPLLSLLVRHDTKGKCELGKVYKLVQFIMDMDDVELCQVPDVQPDMEGQIDQADYYHAMTDGGNSSPDSPSVMTAQLETHTPCTPHLSSDNQTPHPLKDNPTPCPTTVNFFPHPPEDLLPESPVCNAEISGPCNDGDKLQNGDQLHLSSDGDLGTSGLEQEQDQHRLYQQHQKYYLQQQQQQKLDRTHQGGEPQQENLNHSMELDSESDASTVHNDKVICKLCGKDYHSPSALSFHMKNFHSPEKPFECKLCCRKCYTRKLLDEHIRKSHMGQNQAQSLRSPQPSKNVKLDPVIATAPLHTALHSSHPFPGPFAAAGSSSPWES